MRSIQILRSALILAISLCIFLNASAIASPRFSRGVGIFKMMSWAQIEASPSKRFVRPAFREPYRAVSDAEIVGLKKAGFDFVRLTVDPGPFLQFAGSDRDELDAILLHNVSRFLKSGLKVIVDFHPGIQHEDYLPEKLVLALDDPLFTRYVEMIKRTAKLLADVNLVDSVALELMNEPPIGFNVWSARLWDRLQRRLYLAARSESNDLTLILTGAQFGNYTGLIRLNPKGMQDRNTLYTFHYYLPRVFTNQGVSNDETSCVCFFHIPYPPARGSAAQLWPAIEARIRELGSLSLASPVAHKLLVDYFQKPFDEHDIGQHFDEVLEWAKTNGIDPTRIFLGEFGVSRTYGKNLGADDGDAARWLSDVRRAAEIRHFLWAVWEFKGNGGMSIMTSDHSSEVHPLIVDALGLRQPYVRP